MKPMVKHCKFRWEEQMVMEKFIKGEVITSQEVEHALEKLLYNVMASTLYEPYKSYFECFNGLLEIVKIWISYYAKDKNLLKMTDDEVIKAKSMFNKIPFGEAFMKGDFYEEIDIWFDVVVYMGSCPINEKFNPKLIVRKGLQKWNMIKTLKWKVSKTNFALAKT